MAILEITSREFRNKQRSMFDLADNGDQIVIRRGKKCSYALIPMDEESMLLSSGMIERIEKGLQNIREGRTKRYTMEELRIKMGL
jgi:hypothetical protein